MFAEENLYPMLISPISVAVGVVLFVIWVAIAPRMNADAVAVQAKRKLYLGLFLGAGALGILLILLAGLGVGIVVYALGLIVCVHAVEDITSGEEYLGLNPFCFEEAFIDQRPHRLDGGFKKLCGFFEGQ